MYKITKDHGNYELTIDGLEVWVGTLAECKAKIQELKSFLAND